MGFLRNDEPHFLRCALMVIVNCFYGDGTPFFFPTPTRAPPTSKTRSLRHRVLLISYPISNDFFLSPREPSEVTLYGDALFSLGGMIPPLLEVYYSEFFTPRGLPAPGATVFVC